MWSESARTMDGDACPSGSSWGSFMSDAKIMAPRGQLFLTLLPTKQRVGRGVHECQVKSWSRHLAANGSGEQLLTQGPRIQPHACVRYRSPHVREHRQSSGLSLSCMPIAYFQDTGSIVFNTSFKYMGAPKFGTGPGKNEMSNLWPVAKRICPVCGAGFPAGLRICHSCAKPIHYPDGIFYADLKDEFRILRDPCRMVLQAH